MTAPITLQLNGRSRQVNSDPATPLLYVLRDELALNGAKFGCGPFLGTGEAAQGPAAAAIANAVADATGVRIRDLPLSRSRLRAAVGP
jgi:hypothetical protein